MGFLAASAVVLPYVHSSALVVGLIKSRVCVTQVMSSCAIFFVNVVREAIGHFFFLQTYDRPTLL